VPCALCPVPCALCPVPCALCPVPCAASVNTINQLFALYRRPQFYLYMPLVVAIVVCMLLAIHRVEKQQREFGSNSPEYQRVAKFHRFSYAAISGIVGAQSIMFAKTT
jgi:hypothetical protein